MTYDVARDFAAVASYGRIDRVVIAVEGIRRIQEFVTAAKAKPLTFASARGIDDASHRGSASA